MTDKTDNAYGLDQFDYTTFTGDDAARMAEYKEQAINAAIAKELKCLKPGINGHFYDIMIYRKATTFLEKVPEQVPVGRYIDAVQGLLHLASPEIKKYVKATAKESNNPGIILITFTPIPQE
jgi:hypothetical protein